MQVDGREAVLSCDGCMKEGTKSIGDETTLAYCLKPLEKCSQRECVTNNKCTKECLRRTQSNSEDKNNNTHCHDCSLSSSVITKSSSDSNIGTSSGKLPPRNPYKKHSHSGSNVMDITATKQYKEIYADNLRHNGFLLTKQLGVSNYSPDVLRKQYLSSVKKEHARRARADSLKKEEEINKSSDTSSSRSSQTSNSIGSLENIILERNRKMSAPENSEVFYYSHSALNSPTMARKFNSGSYTDISNIIEPPPPQQKQSISARTYSPAVRRKINQRKQETAKRLSVPDISTDVDASLKSSNRTFTPKSKSLTSLSIDDETSETIKENKNNDRHRKDSNPRLQEAHQRQKMRLSRLESFEGILSKATAFLYDTTKKRPPEQG